VRKSIQRDEYRVFASLLRQARANAGVTQRQVAERMEVAHSFINKAEHADLRLDIVQIRDYLHAIGKPFTNFMTEYDEALRDQQPDTGGV